MIIYRGRRLILVSLETRCELLSDIAELQSHTPLVGSSDALDPTPTELISLELKEFGCGGVIGKRRDSCYEIRRRTGVCSSTRSTRHMRS